MRPTEDHPAPRGFDPLLAVILLVALVLRVYEAMRTPLWYDELYSLVASHRALPDALGIARSDVHPPLHFVLTWAWGIFGDSDLAVRSLSILFGMGGLIAAYALAQTMFGRTSARIATLLLALHPWHIYVSQEARSYSILWFALTLSALGAWRWRETGRARDAVLLVVASAFALWTHYIAGLVLAVQFGWGVATLLRDPRRLAQWLALHAGIGLLFAPQFATLWTQIHRVESDHWMQRPDLPALIDLARRIAFSGILFVPVVLALALTPLLWAKSRRAAIFAWTVGPLSVLVCWYLGTRGIRLFGVKYVLFTLPVVMTLVAAGVARLPGRATAPVVAALLAIAALRSAWLRAPQPEAAALARARSHLEAVMRPGDIVFHADTHTLLFAQHYLSQQRHRLLLENQRLPYFEAGLLVADSTRADAAELFAAHDSGARWFAMAARPAGLDTRIARAQFDSLAVARGTTLGVVTVWDGVRP